MSEPRGPQPLFAGGGTEIFPGPWAAVFLTLAALLITSIVFAATQEGLDFIAAVGIGQVVGLGGVAALALRRIPEPHAERIGLRGFDPRLIGPLLLLLPVVIVVSELDNWVRLALPPPEALSQAQQQLAEKLAEWTKIDSTYAAIQTTIVAVGINPVVEGFFYFGVVLQGLVARMGRFWGAFATAILFSSVHFPASGAPGDTIIPITFGLISGSLMALARLATGSVLAAMLLAAAFAVIQLVAAAGTEVISIEGFNASGDHTPALIVIPCLLSTLYATRVLWRLAAVAEVNPPIPEPEDPDDDEGEFFF